MRGTIKKITDKPIKLVKKLKKLLLRRFYSRRYAPSGVEPLQADLFSDGGLSGSRSETRP